METPTKSNAGKGDTPRPFSIDARKFESNWNRIFGPPEQPQIDHSGSIECIQDKTPHSS